MARHRSPRREHGVGVDRVGTDRAGGRPVRFSFVNHLLEQARKHDRRLILLWFATWKNNGPNYAPRWVKLDNDRFPRVVRADGHVLNSLSPHADATLQADSKRSPR